MSEEKPLLLVFGGPNGSGKSSMLRIAAEQSLLPDVYINADDIAKDIAAKQGVDINKISEEHYKKINLEAAQKADLLRADALNKNISFATETVMSTPSKIKLMQEAKAKGYEVQLRYITTQDSQINVNRVLDRVNKGGHYVDPDKTQNRYERAMLLLPLAVQVADVARVYNNSFENPKLILEKTPDREINIYPQNPPNLDSKWTQEKLEQLKAEINKIDRCQAYLQGPSINDLPRQPDSKTLFSAYAKEVLTQNGRAWDNNSNQQIAEKLLKSGISVERTKDIMKHSPEPLKDVCSFVRTIAKSPELQTTMKSKGLDR